MKRNAMIITNYCGCGISLLLARNVSTSTARKCNPYKVLGLKPTATQSEIKAAFYELSKKYHPDKNQGSEICAKKFKDINAAYLTLKNEKLRSKYSREFYCGHDEDYTSNFVKGSYQSRRAAANARADYNYEVERDFYEKTFRVKRRKFYGKTKHYDFDAWYRAHYVDFANGKFHKYQTDYSQSKTDNLSSVTFQSQNLKGYIIGFGLIIIIIYNFVIK